MKTNSDETNLLNLQKQHRELSDCFWQTDPQSCSQMPKAWLRSQRLQLSMHLYLVAGQREKHCLMRRLKYS